VTSKLLPGLTVVNEGTALTLALAAIATVLVVVPVGKLPKSGVVVAEELPHPVNSALIAPKTNIHAATGRRVFPELIFFNLFPPF
jgi:hypothetical protein